MEKSRFYQHLGLNTGSLNTVTVSFDIADFRFFKFQVKQFSGDITGAVITMQESINGIDWFDSGVTISGQGLGASFTSDAELIRFKVTTQSNGASVSDIFMTCKN